jgi:CHRD domain
MKSQLIPLCSWASTRLIRILRVAVVACTALCMLSSTYAATLVYTAFLDGPSESPPNASPGTGTARVDYDNVAHSMRVRVTFADLIGTTTASHIHAPTASPLTGTAGVATQTPSFSGFPLGVTGGSMDTTFDLTLSGSWNPAYVTANGGTTAGAETAFATALAQGKSYLNIHTSFKSAGEIRGFLQLVPEPATVSLSSAGFAGCLLLIGGRKRRAH